MLIEGEMRRALPVVETLMSGGYEAVFVGGCVRDTWMGRKLKDIDIATSATPEQVMALFPHHIPTGLAHGTITVMLGGVAYEVTTYRKESAYEQFRRPSEVEFVTDLEADLLRRDFTINAMALRADGTLVDPFGGAADLAQGILRCVGEADARFQEDALRMVRAVRFAAEFQLRIALGTWRALRRHAHLLTHVAMERVGAEADKMMGGSDPKRAAVLFARSGLLEHTKQALPASVRDAAHRLDAAELLLSGHSDGTRGTEHTELQWLLLSISIGMPPNETENLFDALRFSTKRTSSLAAVMRMWERMKGITADGQASGTSAEADMLYRQWIEAILEEGMPAASLLIEALKAIDHKRAVPSKTSWLPAGQLEQWMKELPVTNLRDLAVKGSDLMRELRKPSGPWLGNLLKQLVHDAAYRKVENNQAALISRGIDYMRERESETR
ncbi:tRNA nucleotidyltransferase (CCA-adding enzyme) [Paenibacillus phyllosphaerae]|uniref:tRNA nucleotidyltransferase (CCA-adding enzyme) n=1 Tax=Paenibacillus phyllosphaerae TaxID=274593 RepID=A0A7W5FLL9_9BACL|nr:CCA tRNA nucleotidyltransferase [Paenibacillus phyllosphaerae]MBB3109316.1 tRNA nucleotidyltransferase (CCA-adding enzyme) [Paenibacillus phyllosphaerae]